VVPQKRDSQLNLISELLQLTSEVSDDLTIINPVNITNTSVAVEEIFQIYGWGAPQTLNGSRELKTGSIKVNERDICPQSHGNRFCAGPTFMGGCQGDDGGAVIANNTLYGLIDYRSADYCREEQPGHLYINVADYSDWIRDTINSSSMLMASLLPMLLAAFLMKLTN